MAYVDSTSAASATVAVPSGSAGDALVAMAQGGSVPSAPDGSWTLIGSINGATPAAVWTKTRTGSEGSNYTFSGASNVHVSDHSGVSATPVDTSGIINDGSGTTATSPATDSAPSGSDLVFGVMTDEDLSGTASGMTQRESYSGGAGGTCRLWTQDGVSGSVGTKSNTIAFSTGWATSILILPPATVPPVVSTLSPADNATGVSVSTDLVVTFDQNIQVGTGDVRVVEDVPSGSAPTIAARNTDAQNTNATTFTIDIPGAGSLAAGDLVFIGFTKDDDEAPTGTYPPTGWSLGASGALGTSGYSAVLWRRCNGTSDGTTITLTESSENWISRGWHVQCGGATLSDPFFATSASGNSAAANPPDASFPWGTEPTAVMYYVGIDGNSSASAHPGGYSNTGTNTTTDGTTGNRVGQAYGDLASTTAGSDNPGALTNTSAQWRAFTFAVRQAWTRTTVETIDITDGGQVSISSDELTITLTPGTLDPSTQYHVEWDAGIVEATDDSTPVAALSDVGAWNFTTGAAAGAAGPFAAGVRQLRANSALYNM